MGKKKLLKKLRKAANELPPAMRLVKTKMLGADILKINPEAKKKDGEPIDPKSFYMYPTPQLVNHYRAMKTAMKSGGLPLAAGYFKAVVDSEKRKAEKKKAA